MAETTTNLILPYTAPNQAQKHVPVNEALLKLDAIVQLTVRDRDLAAPPGTPADGDRYMPAAGATGAWAGWDFNIALFTDGAWQKLEPREGWLCFVADEGKLLVRRASVWSEVGLVETPSGARSSMELPEQLVALSGASVDTTIVIPNRAIVFCVSTRTVTAVTGAASYNCGIVGELTKFGGSLGAAAGSTNAGVIGPTAICAATPVRLSANGGNFTGGAVRVAIHYFLPRVPQS
jgi:hypothetical protein